MTKIPRAITNMLKKDPIIFFLRFEKFVLEILHSNKSINTITGIST